MVHANPHAARVPQQVVRTPLRPRPSAEALSRLEQTEAEAAPVSPAPAHLTLVAAAVVQAKTASVKRRQEASEAVLLLPLPLHPEQGPELEVLIRLQWYAMRPAQVVAAVVVGETLKLQMEEEKPEAAAQEPRIRPKVVES